MLRLISVYVARPVLLGIILTLASALYAREFNWPDYYHIEYGFPAAWLVRTLSTIIGPANRFELQIVSFALDWVFWSAFGAILLIGANRLLRAR